MKKSLLIIAVLSFQFSFSQYIPMLEQDNSWNVIGLDGFGGPPTNVTRSIGGEEIINGLTYKIVENIDCRYREDNGRVYAYWPENDTEYLMYDFTREVGETFEVLSIQDTWCRYIDDQYIEEMSVMNKSTEFIAGEDRIVLELEALGEYIESWIEGIGSTTGFFPNGNGLDSASRLSCFTYQGETYLFNGYTECVILGLADFTKDDIFLSPNPVLNSSMLQLPLEKNINSIKIYDFSGRLLKVGTINKTYYTIDAMDYPSGIYFYQVSSQNELIKTAQFIVK